MNSWEEAYRTTWRSLDDIVCVCELDQKPSPPTQRSTHRGHVEYIERIVLHLGERRQER